MIRKVLQGLIIVIGCCLCPVWLWAMPPEYFSDNGDNLKINVLKDIPENDVNCIFKDSRGYIWIGSLDGLHRYDGYGYKTYRIENNKNSISSNLIIAVDEDSHGNIWIGTYGKGICKLDPKTNTFTSYGYSKTERPDGITNDVSTLMVDRHDRVWIGNWNGTTRVQFDEKMEKIKIADFFPMDSVVDHVPNNVKAIFEDKSGNIWIGTNHFTQLVLNPDAPASNVRFKTFDCMGETICDFENGVLTGGVGINAIVKTASGNSYKIEPISDFRSFLILYHNNKIWNGFRNGISCFEKQANGKWAFSKLLNSNYGNERLSSNIITCLVGDESNKIWVGTRGGGVNVIREVPVSFMNFYHTSEFGSISNNLTRCMFEDSQQNLWIGTEEGGVNYLKNGSNYANGFLKIVANTTQNEDRVYAVGESRIKTDGKVKRTIWLGTSFPAFLTAVNAETMKEIELPDTVRALGHVFAIASQNDSTLWLGTYSEGLWRLVVGPNGQFKDLRQFVPSSVNEHSIDSYIIRSIFVDSKKRVWIGTDKGLNRLSHSESCEKNPKFQKFSIGKTNQNISHDYILQIVEAKNGIIWIGTMGGGLLKYEESTDESAFKFSTISVKDGLPNNTIKTIVEDENGMLWLASNKGLSRYNPKDGSVLNYDKEDGLQDNEEICGLRRKNGDIVMGGIRGFNVFKPSKLTVDTSRPLLYFTDFYILNKKVECNDTVDGVKILDKALEYTHNIVLDYKHNSFSIGFVGVQFNSPQKSNYRYILEGFDKEWYKASPVYRMANYTNIPDGVYKFKVIGSNCDNVWASNPIEVTIRIKPPMYRSGLAFFIYALILIGLIILIVHISQTIVRRKRDLLIANIEKNRLEEITQLKLQFFTNISHEFRTPLSLITTPLEQLINEGRSAFSKEQNYHLNMISRQVGLMIRLVNQILDFRKLDQNKHQIKPSQQGLNGFLQNIFQAFEMLARQKKITYRFTPLTGDDILWFDVDKMEKVIYNLLSNAFKYTGENGVVALNVSDDLVAGMVTITVSDSGTGISAEDSVHIFERYFQGDSKKKHFISGTGIGLALSKGFVDMHHGEIGFNTTENTGTTFFVKLKRGNSHFLPETLADSPSILFQTIPTRDFGDVETVDNHTICKSDSMPALLIVEDNDDLRKQIKNLFKDEFKVYEAGDGEAGLSVCSEKIPDVVITDVMMPKMDGIEMCARIKEHEATSHIPVLILTAKNTADTQIDGYEIGADSYISKPFNIDVLKANVRSLVANREQLRLRFQNEIKINPDLVSNTPADSKFLAKILGLIEKSLADANYSVEQLAEEYGVSRIYLNRKIKALTGETSIQFIRNVKLKYAAEMLRAGNRTVSEVSWDIGYNDINTFRKRFREKFNMSPSEFAAKNKINK